MRKGQVILNLRGIFKLPLAGLLAAWALLGIGSVPMPVSPATGESVLAVPLEPIGIDAGFLEQRTNPIGDHAVFLPRAIGTGDEETSEVQARIAGPAKTDGRTWTFAATRQSPRTGGSFLIPFETGPPPIL